MKTSRMRRLAVWAAGAGTLLVLAGLPVLAQPAAASTLDGVATITNPTTGTTLSSGGSATPFTISLPAGAACTGDTASAPNYEAYSYLVQQGTNPGGNTISGGSPNEGYGLFYGSPGGTGSYYGNESVSTTPLGAITGIPTDFEFAFLVTTLKVPVSSLLYSGGTSGVWEGGIACAPTTGANEGVISDWWNFEVTFSASASDSNGFTWTAVAGGPSSPPSTPEIQWAAVLPLGGIAAMAGGIWLSRRRRVARSPEAAVGA